MESALRVGDGDEEVAILFTEMLHAVTLSV